MTVTLAEIDSRAREIFRLLVETYVETGDPVGSRTLARLLERRQSPVASGLSPATIRNVVADLEEMGLLTAPHISAGRLPTEIGLRLFVNGLLEIGGIGEQERKQLEASCAAQGQPLAQMLDSATRLLSGLSHCAGLVAAPAGDQPIRQIEFVDIGDRRCLLVLVLVDGTVENRIIDLLPDISPTVLISAANYLNARLAGRTLEEAQADIRSEIADCRTELDAAASRVVEAGLAVWARPARSDDVADTPGDGWLIVRGQSHLLNEVNAKADLERVQALLQTLETKETMSRLLASARNGQGVQVYIGAENPLFSRSGCAMIVAPCLNRNERVVGAIGVIGPTRVNYARIVPMVDYTAQLVGRLLGGRAPLEETVKSQ